MSLADPKVRQGGAYHADATGPEVGHLRPTLGPFMLWGLGVGYVISGEYFGWNLGLAAGGTAGMGVAFLLVTLLYVTFVFGYAEMACAIPRAGGVFVYAARSLGPRWGYLGGVAQVVEFVFAPPAIAVAIGAYCTSGGPLSLWEWWPATWGISPATAIALASLLTFTALNAWGVRQAAIFELAVSFVAALGLVWFCVAAWPVLQWHHLASDPWPRGWSGMVQAIPFAMWLYLGIEGLANAAEEALDPQTDIPRGFGAALATLVLLAAMTLVCSIGIGGWPAVVYGKEAGATLVPRDTPILLAVNQFAPAQSMLYRGVIAVGLIGLIASLNGLVMAAARAVFEMGREGFFLRQFGQTHARQQTPVAALAANLVLGLLAVLFCDTSGLITMAAFGALTLYIVGMLALLRLRSTEPDLSRPFRTPGYPWSPYIACVLSAVCLGAMGWSNWQGWDIRKNYTLWYIAYLGAAMIYFECFAKYRLTKDDLKHFHHWD